MAIDNQVPIAVVGMAYRAPGVGRSGMLEYLEQARSAWSKIPQSRFDASAYYKPGADKTGVFRAEGAHFVPDDIYAFDAGFFNMRAEEAKNSDPQHRMLLECAYEAADEAGYALTDLSGKNIGVFIGSGQHEYSQRLGDDPYAAKTWSATGVAPCMAANRVSYFFGIHGPSITMDAACASSVYAAHTAVSALRNGECSAAFVGSAALTLGPGGWLALEKTGALSVHGRSFSYDVKAAGFGRGEGAGCLFIKRLDEALRNNDPIHAVIRSSAVNHGGRSDGITMPNGVAHRMLLRAVHQNAGLDPSETPVVEGHGTGTAAGDPIEASAFVEVLAKGRTEADPIYIGSIKSNFGHLEGASGMLGLIKAIAMVKHGIVLPTAGFESINPGIQSEEKVRILDAPAPWPENEKRRALVTNFGFGGSNSAIIVEAAPQRHTVTNGNGATVLDGASSGPDANGANDTNGTNGTSRTSHCHDPCRLFVFSARSEKSLSAYLSAFDEYLDEMEGDADFTRDLTYTLGQRRTHHAYRAAVAACSLSDLQDSLHGSKPTRIQDRVLAFVFTGQGAQYAQMASNLMRFPIFENAISEAENCLVAMGASWKLTAEISKPKEESRINEAEISQPACTAVQLALVQLLGSWGVRPAVVTGHSSGEIAAAFCAGLVSFRAAVAIAYFRGAAAATLASRQESKGSMLALGIGADAADKLIKEYAAGYATVAAINSADSVTVSGDTEAIDNLQQAAESQSLFARRLNVQMAYHSRHMEAISSYYLQSIEPYCEEESPHMLESGEAFPEFVSSVTGSILQPKAMSASYWTKNLVQPVRFSDAMQRVLDVQGTTGSGASRSPDLVIEVGPHAALKNPIKSVMEQAQAKRTTQSVTATPSYLPTLLRDTRADTALLSLAASLFVAGCPVKLKEVNQTKDESAAVVTGLPAYAWDKSTSYDMEPRATHEKMFPGSPYHPLLGRRIQSTGGKEIAYRQAFTLDEFPWIRDHNVAGAVIFPMTGYMSCAIEAARRTTTASAAAFLVKNFHVVARLEIEEDETVDMITKIRPALIGEGAFSTSAWSFEVSAYSEGNGWTIHAYGLVEPEMEEMSIETPTLGSSASLVDTRAGLIEHDIAYTYDYAGVRATRYGPSFRNSVRFFEGDGYTVLEHRLRDLGEALKLPSPYGSHVTVDPPTLDGFLQGGGPLQKTEDGRRPAQMPNHINRFRVSNTIPTEAGQRFDIVTRLLDYDVKGGRMHIGVAAFARNADNSLRPIAEWESAAFRSIGSADEEIDPVANLPDNWAWDLLSRFDLLPPRALAQQYKVDNLGVLMDERARDLETAARYYIGRAMKEVAHDDHSQLPHHLSQAVKWFRRHVAEDEMDFSHEPREFLERVRTADAQGDLLCAIGENLVPILREEIEPLVLMQEGGKLARHYEADVMNAQLSKVMGKLVKNLSDLEPNLRILEIGAGTAGTTLPIVKALSEDSKDGSFLDYTFTDISYGFFEDARAKLAPWSQRVSYKKLDISQDPLLQGFSPGEFDIVIAANVLHATEDMVTTMQNVRSLMRPRGKLLLLEANVHRAMVLPFILLPGWWYAKDKYRDHDEGPMMPVKTWDQLLQDTGFSGVDTVIHDRPDSDDYTMSITTSTRICKQENGIPITVTGPFLDDEEIDFAQSVSDSIADKLGCYVDFKPFAEVEKDSEMRYIFIDSPHNSVWSGVTAESFEHLQSLLVQNAGILWVVPENGSPETKFAKGVIRTLRIENEPKNLLILDEAQMSPQAATAIVRLAETLLDPEVTRVQDMDFVWHQGIIHVPRMRLQRELKERFAVEQRLLFRKQQNAWQGDRALEMTVDTAGSVDSIYFRRTADLQTPLKEDEVMVKVDAAGVSYRDLSTVLGHVPWSPPGFDGAGTIFKAGSGVNDVHTGDAVMFLALERSAFSTFSKMSSWHVSKIPAGFSITDAASIPLAYTLAVLALDHTAHLRRDETVLVHSAAGAVGQACVTLAQLRGCCVYVTAGTKAKREFLHNHFGIPQHRIFSSRSAHFRDKILSATDQQGIDVVVNSLGAELLTETWDLVAKFGRFVDIGKKDALENNNLPMKPFDSGAAFSSIDLRSLYKHKPQEVKEAFARVSELMNRGLIGPIRPVTVLPISRFDASLRQLRSGDHIGKVVATLGPDESVLAQSDLTPSPSPLRADATYLITGGTRGIGLDLASWMIENGAYNVVLLGRSGASGPAVQELLKKHECSGVNVRALACNVGSREELVKALAEVADLPPIRGVIHSALLLSDKLFENATFEDWETITGPRVQGAWNLHELLPQDMDFFIALGSFLGDTGNGGQAIYAGTAVFYDALANLRNALGQHTVSIALPVVLDVGYVASNNLSAILRETLGATLKMEDIRTIVKGAALGKESPFHYHGKVAAFKMYLNGKAVVDCPWNYVHPVITKERLKEESKKQSSIGGSGSGAAGVFSTSWTAAEDPLVGLTEALITKVSAMTMIDRDEIKADAPIAALGLDSLVSVELRNWIRRETKVELQLSAITKAETLSALAGDILVQYDGATAS